MCKSFHSICNHTLPVSFSQHVFFCADWDEDFFICITFVFFCWGFSNSHHVWSTSGLMLFQLVFPVVNIITHFTLKCYVLVCLYVLTQPFFGHSFITNVTLHVCMRLCNMVVKHKLSEEFSSTCKRQSRSFFLWYCLKCLLKTLLSLKLLPHSWHVISSVAMFIVQCLWRDWWMDIVNWELATFVFREACPPILNKFSLATLYSLCTF